MDTRKNPYLAEPLTTGNCPICPKDGHYTRGLASSGVHLDDAYAAEGDHPAWVRWPLSPVKCVAHLTNMNKQEWLGVLLAARLVQRGRTDGLWLCGSSGDPSVTGDLYSHLHMDIVHVASMMTAEITFGCQDVDTEVGTADLHIYGWDIEKGPKVDEPYNDRNWHANHVYKPFSHAQMCTDGPVHYLITRNRSASSNLLPAIPESEWHELFEVITAMTDWLPGFHFVIDLYTMQAMIFLLKPGARAVITLR